LRGRLVSRSAADVLGEAERLVRAGVKELLIISQDTSAYGRDLGYATSLYRERLVRAKFFDLTEALAQFGVWIRLHYVYPYPHVDEVISLMATGAILPYLDIPFQHAAAPVLKAMRRPGNQEKTLERIAKWRSQCPELTIRSTFIVGFPGETDDDFEFLLNWLTQARLDRVGAFKYEPVAGAAANDLGLPAVPETVKELRYRRLMETQQAISKRRLQQKVGRRLPILIDAADAAIAKGRSPSDAPEIDGTVFVRARRPLRAGDLVTVKIERADAYDLHGVAV
jgi:ribosomal protein S12 methylthiotransferase